MSGLAKLAKYGAKGVDALVDALRSSKNFIKADDEAMALAQQRAALPVEQGGLALSPANTAMERAAAMGFDTPAFHGSPKKFTEFKSNPNGIFFTDSKDLAKEYGNKVYEVLLNTGNEKVFDAAGKSFADAGAYRALTDGVRRLQDESSMVMKNFMDSPNPFLEAPLSTVTAIKNPAQVRAMSAAFDPWRKTAATAAAFGVAAPNLLAEELRKK